MNDRERKEAAGQWLREARKRAGFPSLISFATALGIDQSQVSRYERGTSTVPDDKAERIADVLGMDIIHVRRGLHLWVPETRQWHGDRDPMDEAEELIADSEQRAADLLRKYRRMDERRRQALMDLATVLDETSPQEPSDRGRR